MTAAQKLYEADFFAWTRHQAWELRRPKGLRPNTGSGPDHLYEAEAALLLPETCPFTLDDILRHDWYPERALRPA